MRLLPIFLLCAAAFAQPKADGPVLGMNNFIHAVNDMDKTIAFYQTVFGLPAPPAPRPPNPAVPALVNAPGAQLRVAIFRLPGASFGFELTYFGGVDHKGGQARHPDPGAANLTLRVRELDAIMTELKKAGAQIVTTSGAPVKLGTARIVLARDPDGYLLELIESPPPANAPAGRIWGASMGLTVIDMEATKSFYKNMLGIEIAGKMEFAGDPVIREMVGAPAGSENRELTATIPGTTSRINFYEWKGLARTLFHLRITDPGCPAIALRVADLDALVAKAKSMGVKIVSQGGVPAQFSPTIRNIFIEDPNGFKIELYQQQ